MGDKDRYPQFYQPKPDLTRKVRLALFSLITLATLVGLYLLVTPSNTQVPSRRSRTFEKLVNDGEGFYLDADLAKLDLRPGAGDPRTDERGWMVDPREAAHQAGLQGKHECGALTQEQYWFMDV
jgi:hypothetical protein